MDAGNDVLPNEGIYEIPALPGGIPLWDFGSQIPDGIDQGTWLGVSTSVGGLLGALGGLGYGLATSLGGSALINAIGAGAAIGGVITGAVVAVVILVCWVVELFSDDEEESAEPLQVEDSLSDAGEDEEEEEEDEDTRSGFIDAPGCGTVINCIDLAMESFSDSQFETMLERHSSLLTLQLLGSVLTP